MPGLKQAKDIYERCGSTRDGLSDAEAEYRIGRDGANELRIHKKRPFLKRFFAAMADKLIIILLISAFVSYIADKLCDRSSPDAIIILFIVLMNTLISVVQESRAEKAIEALKSIASPHAEVIRGGRRLTVESRLIAVGDVVLLEKGMRVPADIRITEAYGIAADESMLTGESLPSDKTSDDIPPTKHMTDMHNMLWSSTLITAGHGRGVVTATGMNTFTGSVAGMLSEHGNEDTPLQKRLAKIGSVLGNASLIICAVIFVIALIKGMSPAEMFITSVSLAVAAIPEGLPAIVTLVLSTGVRVMAAKKAVVRKLPAVETLGCATVICSDKTGTLTQNRMTVAEMSGSTKSMLRAMALCSSGSGGTEEALLTKASELGCDREELLKEFPCVNEEPFSSETKRMITLHASASSYIAYMKGAPEVIFPLCGNGNAFSDAASDMSRRGMRVIAFAEGRARTTDINGASFACIGVCGLLDPPREGVKEAVALCVGAGIRPVMITGDNKDTALAIAREIGIYKDGDGVFTESELVELDGKAFDKAVSSARVFARTTPGFKLRIVKSLQAQGEVVAMTGDGVNDAPALRKADIGCAMGRSGTDVAKEAADLVLTDDNFSTIVDAVREGRGLFANIRRSVHFLLACNIGEIFTVFTALLMGLPSPLSAIQLLWVNLVTDTLPAIALGLEGTDPDVMRDKPIGRSSPLFPFKTVLEMVFEGLFIGVLALTAYFIGSLSTPGAAKTMCFAVLSLSQLFHCFDMRTRKSLFSQRLPSNPFMFIAFFICALLQVGVIVIPVLASLFGIVMLSPAQWIYTVLLSVSPIAVSEIYKLFVKYSRKDK